MTGLLSEFASLVAGGLLGYFLGLKQGRAQAQYDQRVATVNELRRRLRETRHALAELATPSEYRRLVMGARPRDELAEEAGEKLDALDGYHSDYARWLDWRTHEQLDAFTDKLAFGLAEVEHRLKEEDDEDEAVRPLWDWLGQEAGGRGRRARRAVRKVSRQATLVAEGVRRLNTLEAWASAVTEFVRGMSLEEWGFLVAVVTLLITLATLVYKAYARRRDRTPSVKMAAHWNLPKGRSGGF